MVARVDTVLREELGIADGLADPACTCSTPAAAPALISSRCSAGSPKRCESKGGDALVGHD